MTSDDNSVNIRSGYHHGGLRAALIAAGLAALERGPVEALSLRALARAANVSATAVYRHFPDKEALLAALAHAALDAMAAEQAATVAAAGASATPLDAFRASGGAYVRFAIAHAEAFRLIWHIVPAGDVLAGPVDAAHPAMQGLRRAVDAVLPADASDGERRATALRCWALVHGLAMLALDRQIALDDAMIDRVIAGLCFA